MTMQKEYVIGIDLGTTNIVVSYCSLTPKDSDIKLFHIPQLVAAGQIEALPMLPALRYHYDQELTDEAVKLPWGSDDISSQLPNAVIGRFAQDLGNKNPTRLVSSAKSWLGYRGESNAEIHLPEKAPEGTDTCTPLEATSSYLAHIVAAWNHHHPKAPMQQQSVVITVPASFDDIARALTIEAIKRVGFKHFTLLEEPQAACYYWVAEHDTDTLKGHKHLMVCDVGGGTTDFTLIKIGKFSENSSVPELERIAVGDHLMLGGDNMDLTLAVRVLQKLEVEPTQRNMSQLLVQCQRAKEALLSEDAPEEMRIQLQTGGSSLFSGVKETRLTQKEVQQALLDGFFPLVASNSYPKTRKRSLTDLTLPYPADAAISRHIASFLNNEQSALNPEQAETDKQFVVPDVWLLNGGPFLSTQIQSRLQSLVEQWSADSAISWLTNPEPQTAVAKGATLYGRAKEQNQQLIKSAVVRHYFLKAVSEQGDQAICVLPKHSELNTVQQLQQVFTLRKGQKVQFDIAHSLAEQSYNLGETLAWHEGLHQLPGLVTQIEGENEVQVQIESSLDELGVLSVVLKELNSETRHELAFNLRTEQETDFNTLHNNIEKAFEAVNSWFGPAGKKPAKEPLRKTLEKLLGKRESWSGADARFIFDHLMSLASRRRRSETHERTWFNIAGFCLRPGIGFAGDTQRIDSVWSLYSQGIQFVQSAEIWAQWWAFWRRAAAGLSQEQQLVLYTDANHVLTANKRKKGGKVKVTAAIEEKIRLIGSLERLPVDIKKSVLNNISNQLSDKKVNKDMAWCAARIINRTMVYAAQELVLPAEEVTLLIDSALALDWKQNPNLALLAVSGAKRCGDEYAVADQLREAVADKLSGQATLLASLNGEKSALQDKQLWGDELPTGLVL
ncbi:hsp70 family protein [Planctobacterium marinum]|uniref:Molecular chaperone DnaK n=1 Tax=Planctobacterium marinum TaxID=1631968 RepID=A0AA48HLI6_9ALTE|nr:molecular chaperone DnaK [Planctobacterium marinum]